MDLSFYVLLLLYTHNPNKELNFMISRLQRTTIPAKAISKCVPFSSYKTNAFTGSWSLNLETNPHFIVWNKNKFCSTDVVYVSTQVFKWKRYGAKTWKQLTIFKTLISILCFKVVDQEKEKRMRTASILKIFNLKIIRYWRSRTLCPKWSTP